jgi:hypothetical protein
VVIKYDIPTKVVIDVIKRTRVINVPNNVSLYFGWFNIFSKEPNFTQ